MYVYIYMYIYIYIYITYIYMYSYVCKIYIHKFLNIHFSNGDVYLHTWIHEHNALIFRGIVRRRVGVGSKRVAKTSKKSTTQHIT